MTVINQRYCSYTTQVRKQAEEAFKQLSQHPDVVPELVKCLQASNEPQLRQLAAVLLRKRVAKHWAGLSREVSTLTAHQRILNFSCYVMFSHDSVRYPVDGTRLEQDSAVSQRSMSSTGCWTGFNCVRP